MDSWLFLIALVRKKKKRYHINGRKILKMFGKGQNHGIFRQKITLPAAFGIKYGTIIWTSSCHGSFTNDQRNNSNPSFSLETWDFTLSQC